MEKKKMKYRGDKKKLIKLPAGGHTSDNVELFMFAEVSPGDIVEVEHERTMEFIKLARCQDGSDAWIIVPKASKVTVTFKTVQPKAPSRRTSWKSRNGRAKK